MAFEPTMMQDIGGLARSGRAARVWAYTTTDVEAAINSAGYFGDQRFAMRVGDLVIRTTVDGSGAHLETGLHVVVTKTATLVTCATAVLAIGTGTGMPIAGGNFTGLVGYTVDDAVAAAGTVQGDATELTAQFSTIATCAAGAGIRLKNVPGVPFYITNITGETPKIWPDAGAKIGGLSTNANDVLEPGRSVVLIKTGATQWRAFA